MMDKGTIEILNAELKEIKDTISQARKAGVDTKIAEMLVMNIPSKILMVKATGEAKDIEKVRLMLQDANAEMGEYKKESFKNAENEERTSGKGGFEQFQALITTATSLLESGKTAEAHAVYTEIQQEYTKLPSDMKKQVFSDCVEIQKGLMKKG
ncbi:MAG: hypothetical protein GY861_06930 [bacterium]|nr:hypothetical protein [bacterium]